MKCVFEMLGRLNILFYCVLCAVNSHLYLVNSACSLHICEDYLVYFLTVIVVEKNCPMWCKCAIIGHCYKPAWL